MFGFGKKQRLDGIRVAVLAADGVEENELAGPWKALRKAGAGLYLISPRLGKIQAVKAFAPARKVPVDATFDEVHPASFAALLLPGGFVSPDLLRRHEKALQFVRSFDRIGKPIAAIGHAAWLLASAGRLQGRKVTSWPGIQDDLRNAGAEWQDKPVVVDGNLLTARGPRDIKKFNKQVVRHFAELMEAY